VVLFGARASSETNDRTNLHEGSHQTTKIYPGIVQQQDAIRQ